MPSTSIHKSSLMTRILCHLVFGDHHASVCEECQPVRIPPAYLPAHDHASSSPSAPLVDLTPTHSGSAMLMLLSVVFVGLAVFVIYKFKRYVSLHPRLSSSTAGSEAFVAVTYLSRAPQ